MDIIKQARISLKDLPSVNSENKYLVRYRIVSDDKNRYSHWSPLYNVPSFIAGETAGTTGDVVQSGNILNVVWTDTYNANAYDVYICYGSATSFTYVGTTTTKNYSFLKQSGYTGGVQVKVEISNQDHIDNNQLIVFYKSLSLV